jgi:hypothetical protein
MHKKEELTTMSTFVASLNQVVLASVRIKNNNGNVWEKNVK